MVSGRFEHCRVVPGSKGSAHYSETPSRGPKPYGPKAQTRKSKSRVLDLHRTRHNTNLNEALMKA